MTKDEIQVAMIKASEFIAQAQIALNRIDRDSTALITGTKETAACKRASMDLTRALAQMRKPS